MKHPINKKRRLTIEQGDNTSRVSLETSSDQEKDIVDVSEKMEDIYNELNILESNYTFHLNYINLYCK